MTEKPNMQQEAILEIDHAALGLVKALEKFGDDLVCFMDMDRLDTLRKEVVNLRRVLLGLEMGALYQKTEYDQDLLVKAVTTTTEPVDKVAAKVIEQVRKK
jgi:hypothetical protein